MLKIYVVLLSIALIGLMVTGYIKERHFAIINNFALKADNVHKNYTCLLLGSSYNALDPNSIYHFYTTCCENNSKESNCLMRITLCPDMRALINDPKSCKTFELDLTTPKWLADYDKEADKVIKDLEKEIKKIK
jgi:hypothetical protein